MGFDYYNYEGMLGLQWSLLPLLLPHPDTSDVSYTWPCPSAPGVLGYRRSGLAGWIQFAHSIHSIPATYVYYCTDWDAPAPAPNTSSLPHRRVALPIDLGIQLCPAFVDSRCMSLNACQEQKGNTVYRAKRLSLAAILRLTARD